MKTTQQPAVAQYLAAQSITFTASYRGVKRKALGGDHPMDEWEVSFSSSRGSDYFEFFTGMGHRTPKKQPVEPSAASVLYCRIGDSRAASMSFSEWCDEYGYDEDSRRAESLYFACAEAGKKLQAVFTPAQLDTLSELLEDY